MEKEHLPQEKYYRKEPARYFDVNQTMYNLVKSENRLRMNTIAIEFLGKKILYSEVMANVDRLADAYSKVAKLKEGDTVAICSINLPIVQDNLLALSKIGVISKWVDLRLKEEDLIKNFNESNCKYIVVLDKITEKINKILSNTNVEKVLVVSAYDYLNPIVRMLANMKDKKNNEFKEFPMDKKFMRYQDFLKLGDINSDIKPVGFEKERPSIIVQSSGSTGFPKSIVHSEYNFNVELQKMAYTDLPFIPGTRMHNSVPPFIIYGLSNASYLNLAFGFNSIMAPLYTEDAIYKDLGKFDESLGTPIQYKYIKDKKIEMEEKIIELEKSISSGYVSKKEVLAELKMLKKEYENMMKGLKSTKIFISGGDKLSGEELAINEQQLNVPIVNGYGNNELTAAAVISPVHMAKYGSVGIPMKDTIVQAYDIETGKKLDVGEIGELCIYSDNIFLYYLNMPDETEIVKVKHDDEKYWLHTGDLGYVDEDGFVYVTGRAKRLIKRLGFKISPDHIENIIESINGISDSLVVGVDDENETEVPFAYYEVTEEYKGIITPDYIREELEKKLPSYKIPKYFVEINKIPYNNNKKAFREMEIKAKEYLNDREYTTNSKLVLKSDYK